MGLSNWVEVRGDGKSSVLSMEINDGLGGRGDKNSKVYSVWE